MFDGDQRALADICRVEAVKGLASTNHAVSHVLRTPIAAEVRSGRTLTNLSTAARIRCFEALAAKPPDWLVNDMDSADAYWHWMIVAAGGHDALIARAADFLEMHQSSPRRKRSLPTADRSALFAAYFRIMQPTGGHRGRPRAHVDDRAAPITAGAILRRQRSLKTVRYLAGQMQWLHEASIGTGVRHT